MSLFFLFSTFFSLTFDCYTKMFSCVSVYHWNKEYEKNCLVECVKTKYWIENTRKCSVGQYTLANVSHIICKLRRLLYRWNAEFTCFHYMRGCVYERAVPIQIVFWAIATNRLIRICSFTSFFFPLSFYIHFFLIFFFWHFIYAIHFEYWRLLLL